jgi:maltose alpha-D-glucosyltransferase/alpha-amylase
VSRSHADAAVIDLWWKNGLVYCVDPKMFLDSNGDGIGDLDGLTSKLDYLASLGVTCLWLMPVCPSPWRDDGYDTADYYSVDPRLGSLGDFVTLVHGAHAIGLRVVLDLALNHTSDQHSWFQQARSDPASRYRDFYIWRDEPPATSPKVAFPGEQDRTWTYDEVAGQYYLHRYYDFMPDLNAENPAVRQEMYKVLGFWTALGVDGFRVDSVPMLIEEIESSEGERASHHYLRDLAEFLSRRKGDAILIGEANLRPRQLSSFFGRDGAEEMQVLFDFASGPGVFVALARGEAAPIVEKLRGRPERPRLSQFLTFLRHHDELTFENTLSEDEKADAFAAFGPEEIHRAFGRGIRRRLAPMLGGDPARLRLALSVLLALPGAPTIFYGDELGVGDNLALRGRTACRVPMQWDGAANGGFTEKAEPMRATSPDGPFGYKAVNVAAQQRDPASLLNWFRRATAIRRQCPAVGSGTWEALDVGDPGVLALRYRWHADDVLTLHNLTAGPATADLGGLTIADELFADAGYAHPDGGPVPLNPYGYRWVTVAPG